MQTELVILAAGMSSRYQGLKQLDAMDKYGNSIMDFSVYDAMQVGFDGVTFVIREGTEEIFKNAIEPKLRGVRVRYAVQRSADIPSTRILPADRVKPWGTGQAILACRNVVDTPFAVINSDDFYGRNSLDVIHSHLSDLADDSSHWCMLGYRLRDTVPTARRVNRAVCDIGDDGYLRRLAERRISKESADYVFFENDKPIRIDPLSIVSMNIWGYTPAIFEELNTGFKSFLDAPDTDLSTGEYQLADAVNAALNARKADVKVYPATDEWFGVTYRADKDSVSAKISALRATGAYPDVLFG